MPPCWHGVTPVYPDRGFLLIYTLRPPAPLRRRRFPQLILPGALPSRLRCQKAAPGSVYCHVHLCTLMYRLLYRRCQKAAPQKQGRGGLAPPQNSQAVLSARPGIRRALPAIPRRLPCEPRAETPGLGHHALLPMDAHLAVRLLRPVPPARVSVLFHLRPSVSFRSVMIYHYDSQYLSRYHFGSVSRTRSGPSISSSISPPRFFFRTYAWVKCSLRAISPVLFRSTQYA